MILTRGPLAGLLLALLALSPASAAPATLPRGVDPAQASLYAGSTFTCKDGSKTIPIERVNDGYCDCFLGECAWGPHACCLQYSLKPGGACTSSGSAVVVLAWCPCALQSCLPSA